VRNPSAKIRVAILRAFLNRHEKFNQKFDQKRFAELIGCSVHTLQSIETGRLKLSQKLAHRIARETGVAVDWLVGKPPKAPIVGELRIVKRRDGTGTLDVRPPYKFQYYEQAQASKIKPDEYLAEDLSAVYLDHYAPILRAILFSAHKQRCLNVALWKISNFLSDCEKQFGADRRVSRKQHEEQTWR